MKESIIAKLKKYNLLGRGGAEFPTALKWESVKKEKAEKKYVVCNGSEGEPGVFKDGFILGNYPGRVIEGIRIALKTVGGNCAFIYLNKDYYRKFKKKLEKLIGNAPISLFERPDGYIAGEETALCEAIEGKRPEPREKPPFPAQSGIFGYPTLIDNVETLYYVAKIAEDDYENTRFYSISGDVKKKGVFELPLDYSISKVLKETGNLPDFDFFIQVGGGASGEVLLPGELKNRKVCGAGAIVVYDRKKTSPMILMKKWANFFNTGNCDKCVPCREGAFRIMKMLKKGKISQGIMQDMLFVLRETSFCALGEGMVVPFETLLNKIYKK
ncbi:MAG: NADH-ubiquinone oxidoreductase-F iron-sulfur binding region domain-containing protein [Patescibacteria group bacterium]